MRWMNTCKLPTELFSGSVARVTRRTGRWLSYEHAVSEDHLGHELYTLLLPT